MPLPITAHDVYHALARAKSPDGPRDCSLCPSVLRSLPVIVETDDRLLGFGKAVAVEVSAVGLVIRIEADSDALRSTRCVGCPL